MKEPSFPTNIEELRRLIMDHVANELKEYDMDIALKEADVEPTVKKVVEPMNKTIADHRNAVDKSLETIALRTEDLNRTSGDMAKAAVETSNKALEQNGKRLEQIEHKLEAVRRMLSKKTVSEESTVKASEVLASLDMVMGDSPYMSFLARYGSPGKSLKPMLIIGGQGSGKTTGAMQFAYGSGFEAVVFMEGHRGIEAMDLIGGPRPEGGTTIWQDGKVAKAFRHAESGQKTCLIIDELFRIRQPDRSPLISALVPFRYPDGVRKYRLSTGRIMSIKDGVAVGEEVIFAPCCNLTIIGTTNIGSGFDIDAADPAEAGRWVHFDVESTEANARYILNKVCKEHGWTEADSEKVIKKLLVVLKNGQTLYKDNFLVMSPDVRILADSIHLANKPSDVPSILKEVAIVWVGHNIDGQRSEEQMASFVKLINDSFK